MPVNADLSKPAGGPFQEPPVDKLATWRRKLTVAAELRAVHGVRLASEKCAACNECRNQAGGYKVRRFCA